MKKITFTLINNPRKKNMNFAEGERKLETDTISLENAFLTRLNEKIEQYNKLSDKPTINRLACIFLLLEINYMHMDIKKRLIDASGSNELADMRDYYIPIRDFLGVGPELEKFGLRGANGLAAHGALLKTLKYPGFPSEREWKTIAQSDKQLLGFMQPIKQLNQMKAKLSLLPSSTQEYFYALKTTQKDLLQLLSYDPDNILGDNNSARRSALEGLLANVSQEILTIQESCPGIKKNLASALEIGQTQIVQEISQLDSSDMDKLIQWLRSPQALDQSPLKMEIFDKLEILSHCNIVVLSAGNNINFKVTDPNGVAMVFQIGAPVDNQSLVDLLEQSSANNFLAPSVFASAIGTEQFYSITVMPYYSGGNVRSREEKASEMDPSKKISNGIKILSQLTSMCESFAKKGALYSDIKLTNFLIDSEGNMITTDKKSFLKIDSKGMVDFRQLQYTESFAPPECTAAKKAVREKKPALINAEAFNVYQLGLALYEVIVLPNEANWPKNALEFPDNIFKNKDKGPEIKALIIAMTSLDPNKRPNLSEVQRKLHAYGLAPVQRQDTKTGLEYSSSFRNRFQAIVHEGNKVPESLAQKFGQSDPEQLKQSIFYNFQHKIVLVDSSDALKKLKEKIEKTEEYQYLKKNPAKNPKINFMEDLQQMFTIQQEAIDAKAASQSSSVQYNSSM